MISWLALLAVPLPLVSAFHHHSHRHHARAQAQTICEQYGEVIMEPYSLLTDLWGSANGEGSQCSTIDSVVDDVVTWSTTFSWTDSTSIMSYSNIQLNEGLNTQLSEISSMPSQWTWSVDNEDIRADVTYDIFTSYSPGGNNAYEIMVWLANLDVKPISYQYDYSGKPIPIATDLDINGYRWDLYRGSNNYNIVLSFVPVDGSIPSWNVDIYNFFAYLIQSGDIESSQYLKTAQAGIEVTLGAGTFETSAYSLAIN